jgi:hypothetical protein
MGTGNDNNTWGTNANTSVFQVLVDAITNSLTSIVTGGTLDLSGSPPPNAASQTRFGFLIFSGVLTGNQTIIVPNFLKFWRVKNLCTGAFTLQFKTPTGSLSAAIPANGAYQGVQCDGANGITISPFNAAQVQMPDGTVSVPAYSNVNEPTSGLYRAGASDWRFSLLGTDVFRLTPTGLTSPVGIASSGGGVGYATGAGGTVSQATNKSTITEIDTFCGDITTSNSLLPGLSSVSFQVSNNKVLAGDLIALEIVNVASLTSFYNVYASEVTNGSFNIWILNIGTDASDFIHLRFAIIRTVQA